MDRVETANQARAKQWTKEAKVGEGTYAVVYRGNELSRLHAEETIFIFNATGRAAATGQRIAIKKIKVGEFKDGLDMSAVREVQYLRELSHPNVIKVSR
jgi:cyclin-dependent kinase 7